MDISSDLVFYLIFLLEHSESKLTNLLTLTIFRALAIAILLSLVV